MMILQATWIWTVWVLPNICIIQPLTWYYYSARFRRLGNLLTQWNRSYHYDQNTDPERNYI